ncbi:MAG: 30S ribosomal protein S20 [Candidatus Babeliales bacterium]
MANTKSAQKQARQNAVARQRNLARRTSIKSAVKKVLSAIEKNDTLESVQALLKEAESKLARAKSKGVIHANTARRKIGRLAKRVSALQKEQLAPAKKK